MEYLALHKEHSFSAYDVNEYMQSNGIQVNLTTIYRNLDKLTESGEIMKYKTAEDIRRYTGLPTLAVVPVEDPAAEEKSRRNARRTGGNGE